MEWIILLAIIAGVIYWYKNHSDKAKGLQLENQIVLMTQEADEAYKWLIEYLNKLIKEDIPKWEKEDAKRLEDLKKRYKNDKSFPKVLLKKTDRIEQLRTYTRTLDDVKEMRDQIIKWSVRNRNASVKERLEVAQDWDTYIQVVANRNFYRGFEGIVPTDDDYEIQSVLLREIKSKYK